MDRWREATVLRLTLVLLTGGTCLIAAGLAGLGASVPLALALVVLGGALYPLGRRVADTPLARIDPYRFAPDLAFGPPIGGVVTLLWLGASPGEVQALGGLIGLVGMANYFLRPVYQAGNYLLARLAGT